MTSAGCQNSHLVSFLESGRGLEENFCECLLGVCRGGNVGADIPGQKTYIGMNQGLKNKDCSLLMVEIFSITSL